MFTTQMLADRWKQLAIEVGGHVEPMDRKFSECLGVDDGVAVFIIDGMDKGLDQSRCYLAVGDDGYSCWDYGVSKEPFRVGDIVDLNKRGH